MAKYIDKSPPRPTGDQEADAMAIYNYLCYVQEQLNFILTQLYKNSRNGGAGNG